LRSTLKQFEENNADNSKDDMIARIKKRLDEIAMKEVEDLLAKDI
jgi:hypothetical protein